MDKHKKILSKYFDILENNYEHCFIKRTAGLTQPVYNYSFLYMETTPEGLPNWPIKKGTRRIIEVEFLEDMNLYAKGGVLQSLYGHEEKNPFKEHGIKVTMVSSMSWDESIEDIKKKLTEEIKNINL